MRKIGIVGGLSWQSTIEYYSELCQRSLRWHSGKRSGSSPGTPEICIESLDLSTAVSYFGIADDEGSWSKFDEYHRGALRRLVHAGAEIAIIASNTPHHRFEQIVAGIGIPVIHIVDAVAAACTKLGIRELLLLGTELTMTSHVFRSRFAMYGIAANGPDDPDVRAETTALISALQRNQLAAAEARLRNITARALGDAKGRAVCLACTELPLALRDSRSLEAFVFDDALYINANVIHVNAALRASIGPAVAR